MSPIRVVTKCPRITFRGCANGDSGSTNKTKIDAPNETVIIGCLVKYAKLPMTHAARKTPIEVKPNSLSGGLGGIGAVEPLSLVRYDIIHFEI